MPIEDLTGRKFGRLTVIERVNDNVSPCGYHNAMWRCQCDCGNELVTRGKSLTHGLQNHVGVYVKK